MQKVLGHSLFLCLLKESPFMCVLDHIRVIHSSPYVPSARSCWKGKQIGQTSMWLTHSTSAHVGQNAASEFLTEVKGKKCII